MSDLEDALAYQLRVCGLSGYEREYRFHPKRRWRADFAWKDARLLVEVDGGIWNHGRHNRGAGFEKDMEKLNAATLLGFRILRFSPKMIKSGEAVNQIETALRGI